MCNTLAVSTSVSRYRYLSGKESERNERATRVRVCQLELIPGQPPTQNRFTDSDSLKAALSSTDLASRDDSARVYVCEDLSRDVIELFGSAFNVDPHFWRSHVNDSMYNTLAGDASELSRLDLVTRKSSFYTMQYLRPRYFRSTTSFQRATKEAAQFNVIRQLDSDRSRDIWKDENGAAATLQRAKASVWIRPDRRDNKSVIGKIANPQDLPCLILTWPAIILVDPTLSEGYPLWGGYTAFDGWPNNTVEGTLSAPPRTSLYEDVIYWMGKRSDDDINQMVANPESCALPALWLIVSDWRHVIQYITAQLGQIEWEIELPTMRKDASGIDGTMNRLHPWRRNVPLYRRMVVRAIDLIFSKPLQQQYKNDPPDHGLPALLRDFEIVLEDINDIHSRIDRIVSVAAALLSIEEGRRATDQNNNVARLTYLATIFIPLSFVSSFFSMAPDVTALQRTFWIFFVIAIPLTAMTLFAADFLGTRRRFKQALTGRKAKLE